MKMSPVNGAGSTPLQSHPQTFNRTYSYPLPGPVLSNVNNPGGQLQMVGGLPHAMVPGGFNSGHAAAHMQQLYGHPHQQSQQNDRPFKCDQCPQSFNRNHDLKRHKRIHLAVKPFPCGHCDKSFSRKDALKVRTHTVTCHWSPATDICNSDTYSSKGAVKRQQQRRSRRLTGLSLPNRTAPIEAT